MTPEISKKKKEKELSGPRGTEDSAFILLMKGLSFAS